MKLGDSIRIFWIGSHGRRVAETFLGIIGAATFVWFIFLFAEYVATCGQDREHDYRRFISGKLPVDRFGKY